MERAIKEIIDDFQRRADNYGGHGYNEYERSIFRECIRRLRKVLHDWKSARCAHETVTPVSCMAENVSRCNRTREVHQFLESTNRIDHRFEESLAS